MIGGNFIGTWVESECSGSRSLNGYGSDRALGLGVVFAWPSMRICCTA